MGRLIGASRHGFDAARTRDETSPARQAHELTIGKGKGIAGAYAPPTLVLLAMDWPDGADAGDAARQLRLSGAVSANVLFLRRAENPVILKILSW